MGLLFSVTARAAVMVAPVEGTNLDPGEVEAISQTVASAYQVAQPDAVIPMPETRRALEQTGGVQEAAKKLGANEYIYATAVRLDTRIVITATRYSVNGALLRSAKMTATGLDDVEPASERLAKALSGHQETHATQALDTVTKTEARSPNRTWSEKVTGFKAGFIYPIGWGHEISPMMSAGFALRVDSNSHFLEFGVGVVLPANPGEDHRLGYGGVYGDIGANFYLAHASTSPYLGFGVMPRLVSQEVTNLAPYGQAGLMFFRESSTRLYADFRVAQNVLPVGFGGSSQYDSTTGNYVSTPPLHLYPTELSLHFGVGW
ncbi:MAG: hypothetical protein ABI335_19410 [Polyangiaceae bacterium]